MGKARPECLVSFLPLVLDKLLLLMVNIINNEYIANVEIIV